MQLGRVVTLLVVWLLVLACRDARAQEPTAPDPPARPWTFDLFGTFLAEAWDYNLSKENLAGGSVGVRRRWTDRWSIGGEVGMYAAKQRGYKKDAVLVGGGPVIRAEFRQTPRVAIAADIMLGLSQADRRVPPRGTRFNYLARAGGGLSYTFTPSITGTLFVTYLHLSNASHEGPDRNPDIQAFGGMMGISVPF